MTTKMRKMRDPRNVICSLAGKNREWMRGTNRRRKFRADDVAAALQFKTPATQVVVGLVWI